MGMTANAPRQTQSHRIWGIDKKWRQVLLYSILAAPLIALLAFVLIQPIKVLPRISLAPGFALTDQDGNRLTNEDLRGSLTLYTFTYTNCGDGCAQTGPGMKAVQEAVAAVDTGGIPVQLVTISFDPERDSPEVLRQYADALGADTSNWHFVTGEPTRLKNVIGRGFSTFYEQRADGSFEFYPTFVLVDGWGIMRAKYRTDAPDTEIVQRDLQLLTKEIRNSKGASKFAYEAAHLFLCYPDY